MSTPDTLRWWGDQIRKCTREFYFSHVLVADLNYGADEIEKLQAENAKLRELMMRMADALGIYSEWADANWCKSPCRLEFECWPEDMAIRCPAWAAMRELGIEVPA